MSANEGKYLIHYEHLATENAILMPLNQETFKDCSKAKMPKSALEVHMSMKSK